MKKEILSKATKAKIGAAALTIMTLFGAAACDNPTNNTEQPGYNSLTAVRGTIQFHVLEAAKNQKDNVSTAVSIANLSETDADSLSVGVEKWTLDPNASGRSFAKNEQTGKISVTNNNANDIIDDLIYAESIFLGHNPLPL